MVLVTMYEESEPTNLLSFLLSQVYGHREVAGSEDSHEIGMTFVIGFLFEKGLRVRSVASTASNQGSMLCEMAQCQEIKNVAWLNILKKVSRTLMGQIRNRR